MSRNCDAIFEAYQTWPDDIRAKLSAHDLRRMAGWAPKVSLSEWRIDTSAGGPILVHKDCSVIEGEQARYVLGLIERDQASRRRHDGISLSYQLHQYAKEHRSGLLHECADALEQYENTRAHVSVTNDPRVVELVLFEMEAGAVYLLPDPAPDVIRGWAKRLRAALANLEKKE